MKGLASDQVLAFVLLDLAVILVVARLVGRLATRIGQPVVVGEIVAGVLLGPTLLGPALFAWDAPWSFLHCTEALSVTGGDPSISSCLFPPQARSMLGVIGQLALVLFMFLVGLELDWKLLAGRGRRIAAVAFGAVAVPVALAFVVGPLLYRSDFVGGFGAAAAPSESTFTLYVAAMLSVTAFPVMARILQEKRLIGSPMGATGVAAAAVVTVLMFLVLATASSAARGAGAGSLARTFAATAIFLTVMLLVVRRLLVRWGRAWDASGAPLAPGAFAGVLVLVLASALLAHRIGINVIVGGFVAGAVLPARRRLFAEMSARLGDLTAVVLLPVFLAFSGLNTDATKLPLVALPGIAVFLVAGVVGKWGGSAVGARLAGFSWQEGHLLGVLMNCRGLLVLVVALIALSEGVITPAMQVGGVLMALVTTMMTGPLFDALRRRSADGARAGAAEPDVDHVPLPTPTTVGA